MDQEHEFYKVCPECAGEYRPDIERCADCDVPLVHPEEIAFRDARELPLSGGLVALRTAPIAWVRTLAQDLSSFRGSSLRLRDGDPRPQIASRGARKRIRGLR